MGRKFVSVVNATSVREALQALSRLPEATLIQGGTDVMVEVNFGRREPRDVVSLRSIDALKTWRRNDDGSVFIGAGLPYQTMESGELAELFPALAEAARTVGSPQIRAAGTLGGNLGTCSPAGDGLPVLAALDGLVHLESLEGERQVPFVEFMIGVKKSVIRRGEIITGVTLPIRTGFQGYAKVGVRNAMVISIASACLVHDQEKNRVGLAVGAVAPTIVRCIEAENLVNGHVAEGGSVTPTLIDAFAQKAVDATSPITDHRSTAEYRKHAIAVLSRRLMERAFDVRH
jgi:CO/xanthine dehydrogenase FAD-binding subunit